MTVLWPGTLPRAPLVRSLSEMPPSGTIRSSMDVGPDKLRRRATTDPRVMTLAFSMTGNQLASFEGFYDIGTKQGSLSFSGLRNPHTGEDATWRIIGKPQYQPLSPRENGLEYWRVSFNAEILPTVAAVVPPTPTQVPARHDGYEDEECEDCDGGDGFVEPFISGGGDGGGGVTIDSAGGQSNTGSQSVSR